MSGKAPAKLPFTDLPEGTVTFLFTDIAGSTQLESQLCDQYARLLSDQRNILRKAFSRWQGGRSIPRRTPSAWHLRATQAVSATVEIQRALSEHH